MIIIFYIIYVILLLSNCKIASPECPNGCSGHGKCDTFDSCTCHQSWIANDCSQRLCPFGRSHVDTPRGDLDFSEGELARDTKVAIGSQIYPYGSYELYPRMLTSNGEVLTNTAHDYMECSNKGYCNRVQGNCECFPGYDGSACQRASCPTSPANDLQCNGVGVCLTISELAKYDSDNIYKLWDKDSTMGCYCDSNYYGADCALRRCKIDYDPVYLEQKFASARHSNFTFNIYTTSETASITGNYSLQFYDVYGESWITDAIDSQATCSDLISSLEALPNHAIPKGTIRCIKFDDYHTISIDDDPSLVQRTSSNPYYGTAYSLAFPANPGRLMQPEIKVYLDGRRTTLEAQDIPSLKTVVKTSVYSNGFHGEMEDVVPNICNDVIVNLQSQSSYDILTGNIMEGGERSEVK